MADGSCSTIQQELDQMDSFTPGPETTRAFRDTLGCFATGITVITCVDATGPLAMTANSFASVSLDPALVLWSPAISSARHNSFVEADHCAIHVLTGDQGALAARFATDGRAFLADEWAADAHGTPLLSNCLARFVCKRFALHPAGDHTLILGQVTQAAKGTGSPLVFAQGKYGQFTYGS
jgi:flavin reductase (DIM6/NTAB) family NADH-FMN oxidoreductase RutF